jgi:phage/plasmid-like protein (TIGR03299 family)
VEEFRVVANVENMVSTRSMKPWHGIGTVVEQDGLTSVEALKLGGLDWQVDLFPKEVVIDRSGVDAFGKYVEEIRRDRIPNSLAVVRSDNDLVLGEVSKRYTPVQNREAFAFFDSVVGAGDAAYETAGSLDLGRRVFLTARMNRDLNIGGVDVVETYLLMANSHDGTMSFTAAVTPVRVVCQNTLNLALKGAKQKWTMRHTASIDGKLEDARQALGLTTLYVDAFQKQAEDLIQQDLSKKQFEVMLKEVFKDEKAEKTGFFTPLQASLMTNFESTRTLDDSFRMTKWGAVNAVGEYFEWGKNYRAGDKSNPDEARANSSLFGGQAEKARDNALKYLLTV